jgi:hypothetical protein
MVACAIVALGFGFFVLNYRSSDTLPIDQQTNVDNNNSTDTQPEENVDTTPLVVPSDWKVYTNDKHGFTVQYPSNLKAGSISDNSILGTFQVPVRGYFVGPLVFVVLKDADLKKDAKELFDNVYNTAKNPTSMEGTEVPVECKIILDTDKKKVVGCAGEGGDAKYAYISGANYDVFVDGYTKGYSQQDVGKIKDDKELSTIVSSFTFAGEASASNSNSSSNTTATTTTTPTTPPTIQSFIINADDAAATPSEITVTQGQIVQITFMVGTNTYYGGLDFKSSVVNSGTVNAGSSKTISFKADQSFEFTPYWPASNTAKGYKIKVIVNPNEA